MKKKDNLVEASNNIVHTQKSSDPPNTTKTIKTYSQNTPSLKLILCIAYTLSQIYTRHDKQGIKKNALQKSFSGPKDKKTKKNRGLTRYTLLTNNEQTTAKISSHALIAPCLTYT